MNTIDVSSDVLRGMALEAKTIPTNYSCNNCGIVVSGLLPNNKKNNYVYGIVNPHYRIICGIHESVICIPYERVLCFCLNCGSLILKKIPNLLSANDPADPIRGGHFITTSELDSRGRTLQFARLQSELEEFRQKLEILSRP
jgi:hypothetical protein